MLEVIIFILDNYYFLFRTQLQELIWFLSNKCYLFIFLFGSLKTVGEGAFHLCKVSVNVLFKLQCSDVATFYGNWRRINLIVLYNQTRQMICFTYRFISALQLEPKEEAVQVV